MDQLTYDLRHLKTGFNNYQQRKMMRVCIYWIVLFITGNLLLVLFFKSVHLQIPVTLNLQVGAFLFQQEQEEREREELLNRRFTTVSYEKHLIRFVLLNITYASSER